MKKAMIVLLVFVLAIVSCKSPGRLIRNGSFDQAITLLVKKLRLKPDDEKNISSLTYAWRVANQINHDSLKLLRQSGQPDIWYEVFKNYQELQKRQDLVKTLPEEVLNKVGFKYLDFSNDLENSRLKAATFLYAKAEKLLGSGNKEDAREAYGDLRKVARLYNDYRNTDELLRKALVAGTDYILYKVTDRTGYVIPQTFIFKLQQIDRHLPDREFIHFDTYEVKDRLYDYLVELELNGLLIAPEKIRETNYTETKEVIVDYEVEKDDQGNILKNTEGEPVKKPVYKTISCKVTRFEKTKSVRADAFVHFRNLGTDRIVNTTPVTAESHFICVFAIVKGDITACSEETLQLLNQPDLPFPTDMALLDDLAEKVNKAVESILWSDERYIEQD